MKLTNLKISFLVGLIFFILGITTLSRYGINWDTINHLTRGQTYLHYFLTGEKEFVGSNQLYWQDPKSLSIKTDIAISEITGRSFYQNKETTFDYFMKYDGYGHPPLSDILSSAFNQIFFNKLKLINDIDSYHVYGLLLAAFLVGLVFWWTSEKYGFSTGIIAALALGLYPLFWSESHFNTEKDIPEAVFWSFMLFTVWRGITTKKLKWLLVSGLFFGLAFGTKFNILFSILILIPWFVHFALNNKKEFTKRYLSRLFVFGLAALILGFTIFFVSWPWLWPDPLGRIITVFSFYKDIGTTSSFNQQYLGPFGINTYPIQWILFTTPPVLLVLGVIGIISILKRLKNKKDTTSLLFLLWFIVPIARVTVHGTTIYGGVRQIMEYIPALAILSAIGGKWILDKFKLNKILSFVFIIFVSISLLWPIVKTHPNENTYFNFLVGGLKGAKEKNLPSWGNSFGSAYRQAIVWIDENAEKDANLVLAYELLPNIPKIWIRQDINFHNSNRSGYLMKGEYALTLTYEGTKDRSYYDSYLENFLKPVYEVRVDDVAIAKVWKNDEAHLKSKINERIIKNAKVAKTDYGMRFDLGNIEKLLRLEILYTEDKNCKKLTAGYLQISTDNKVWKRLPGVLPDDWRISSMGEQPKGGKFIEPFVGQEARYIDLSLSPDDTCLYNIKKFSLYTF